MVHQVSSDHMRDVHGWSQVLVLGAQELLDSSISARPIPPAYPQVGRAILLIESVPLGVSRQVCYPFWADIGRNDASRIVAPGLPSGHGKPYRSGSDTRADLEHSSPLQRHHPIQSHLKQDPSSRVIGATYGWRSGPTAQAKVDGILEVL